MGIALDSYIENVTQASDVLGDVSKGLTVVGYRLGQIKSAITDAENAVKSTEDLDKLVKNLEKAAEILKKFPPLKTVATLAEDILEKAKNRTDDFEDAVKNFRDELKTFKEGINDKQIVVKAVQLSVANDKGDIDSVLPGLLNLQAVFETAGSNAPDEMIAREADLESLFLSLEPNFPGATIDDLGLKMDILGDQIRKIELATANFAIIGDAFDGVLSRIDFLADPLDALVDAVGGYTWILDKAEAAISFVLDPILNPILDAFGITALIDKVGEKVTSLLPNTTLLNPLNSLGADLQVAFTAPTVDFPDWRFPLLDQLLSAKNTLVSQLFGENGYIAPLLDGGGPDFDAFVLRTTLFDDSALADGEGSGDIIVGSDDDDTLLGGDGEDLFIASAGTDEVRGGAGISDIFATPGEFSDYDRLIETVDDGLGGTIQRLRLTYNADDPAIDGVSYVYEDVEILSFDGSVFTTSALLTSQQIDYGDSQVLDGTPGNDFLFGGNLDDTLNGFAGDDILVGNEMSDVLDGGADDDTVNYAAEGSSSGVTAVLDPALFYATFNTDTLVSIENVIGTSGRDILVGDAGANRLSGGDDFDRLTGGAGGDLIDGGDGVDVITGGLGSDTMFGGEGQDYFAGSTSADIYTNGTKPDGSTAFPITEFDALYYNNGNSDAAAAFNLSSPDTIVGNLDSFDETALDLLPDLITVRLGAHGGYEVLKSQVGYGQSIDILNGDFLVLATDANETFDLANKTIVIDGGGGNDLFNGVLPEEEAPGDFARSLLFGGDGNDTLLTATGDEHFVGGAGEDLVQIIDSANPDYLPGEDGARVRFLYGDGSPTVTNNSQGELAFAGQTPASTDIDTLDLSASALKWAYYAEGGRNLWGMDVNERYNPITQDFIATDQFRINGFERIVGSDQTENFFGVTWDMIFEGNGGDDIIYINNGYDLHFDGGAGDDRVFAANGIDTLFGGEGDDWLSNSGNTTGAVEEMYGGAGEDYLEVSYFNDGEFIIDGGTGRDFLAFFTNDTRTVFADVADQSVISNGVTHQLISIEHIQTGSGDDTIVGDLNDNVLAGFWGDDRLEGGEGNDILSANDGNDTVSGGAGDDLILVGDGTNSVSGGAQMDRLVLDQEIRYSFETLFRFQIMTDTTGWVVDMEAGTATRNDGRGVTSFVQIEAITGSLSNDTVTGVNGQNLNADGFEGDDVLNGRDGEDTLNGGEGDDTVLGGEGNDTLTPGGGTDTVDGQGGIDFLSFGEETGAIAIELGGLTKNAGYYFEDTTPDRITFEIPDPLASSTRIEDIEIFQLSSQGDSFHGDTFDEEVRGMEGNDTLVGRGGGDTISGGDGNDFINGFGGNPVTPDLVYINEDSANNDFLAVAGFDMPTDSFTVEMIIRTTDLPPSAGTAIMSYAVSGSTNEFSLFAHQASSGPILRLIINGEITDTDVSLTSVFNDTNKRLSVSWESGTGAAQVFVDGALAWSGTGNSTPLTTGGFLMFGQDQDGSEPFPTGTIDPVQAFDGAFGDIRIWNRTLDQAEIAPRAGVELNNPAGEDGLVHYWKATSGGISTEVGDTLSVFGGSRFQAVDTVHTDEADSLSGDAGNDTLIGAVGNDTLDGGDGNDELFGGSQNDAGVGGRGSDFLFGESGEDSLEGGDGFDLLNGGSGNDTLEGNNGNDRLFGNLGFDSILGGVGNDSLYGGPSGNDTLDGGEGDDLMFGEAGADNMNGGAGNDTLNGGSGNDLLLGGADDDLLNGGLGNDLIFGGPTGQDTLNGDQGSDFLFAESADDVMNGGDGFDLMNGGAGNDLMSGGNGNDRLEGNLGADTLDGGSGDDELFGGNGAWDDTLIGGTGNDTLVGEGGMDTFVFADGFGDDRINDFNALSSLERIDLSMVSAIVDFNDLTANHLITSGPDALIIDGANSISLVGVSVSDLGADDFIFI